MATARQSRIVMGVLAVVAVYLSFEMVRPFATALFLAAVLAAALSPWNDRLAALLGGRRGMASGLMTLGLLLVIVGPLATVAAMLVKQVFSGVAWVRQALAGQGLEGMLEHLPSGLQDLARRALAELPHGAEQFDQLARTWAGRAAAALGGLLTATGTALAQTLLFLVAFFFLIADGRRLVEWLKESVPLQPGQLAQLLEIFRRVVVSVLVSVLGTAGVQSVLALVGYLIAGVPSAVFFTFVTFVMALIPIGGATIVVLGLAALKLATGHALAAGFLALWGVAVVSMVDNIVKPLLMRSGFSIHVGAIFFGFLGGLAAFGPVGLLVGPLVVAFLIAVAKIIARDYGGAR